VNQEEFLNILDHMRTSSVPWRLAFIWNQSETILRDILSKYDVELSQIDLIANHDSKINGFKDIQKAIENWLESECKRYEAERKEPSALIIRNAILLARYSCDLSPILRHGISPRSAVILVVPPDSIKRIPPRAEAWVKKNAGGIVLQMTKQLGITKSIIRD